MYFSIFGGERSISKDRKMFNKIIFFSAIKRMDSRLLQLLNDCKNEDSEVIKSGNFTHQSLFGPRERWILNPSKYAHFWSEYCKILNEGSNTLCLAEKTPEYAPIIADFRLKFHFEARSSSDLYDDDFLLIVVKIYQDVIDEMLQITDSKMELLAVVLESKSSWFEDEVVYRSFRIQFPYCKINNYVQTQLIRPRVIQLLRLNNVIAVFQEVSRLMIGMILLILRFLKNPS